MKPTYIILIVMAFVLGASWLVQQALRTPDIIVTEQPIHKLPTASEHPVTPPAAGAP